MPNLSTEFCTLKFRNPLMLASGVMGLTADSMLRAAKSGAGCVVIKDIGEKPRMGHPNPVVFQNEHYLLNAMGMCNPGVENIRDEVEALVGKVPVIANIFADSDEGFANVAKRMEGFGVSALELNVSCPNIRVGENIGMALGKNAALIERITRKVKSTVAIPVFVKLTPNVDDIVPLAIAAEKGGADGITAINTVGPGMAINIDAMAPYLSNKFGGMSGPAIKPLAVASVFKIFESVKIPILGVGGITTGEDAIEMMLAGARAVQIGSGVFYRSMDVFSKVELEMQSYMGRKGITNIDDIIGKAH